jgi:hypothetical protein
MVGHDYMIMRREDCEFQAGLHYLSKKKKNKLKTQKKRKKHQPMNQKKIPKSQPQQQT